MSAPSTPPANHATRSTASQLSRADPLVRAGSPWTRSQPHQPPCDPREADQGVRPTIVPKVAHRIDNLPYRNGAGYAFPNPLKHQPPLSPYRRNSLGAPPAPGILLAPLHILQHRVHPFPQPDAGVWLLDESGKAVGRKPAHGIGLGITAGKHHSRIRPNVANLP